jgi:peptidoglycan-N-acetylglucosamine deacetylase
VNRRLMLCALLLMAVGGCAGNDVVAPAASERYIALTFDDATLPGGPLFEGNERTRRLITALRDAGVGQAMFFVTTGNVAAVTDGVERIRAYAAAGHQLGNHSHSHRWLHELDADEYIADMDRASESLRQFDHVQPWYRFPFLDEGRDEAKRDTVRAALAERGLHNGYVTVDTWDWYLVSLVAEAKAAGIDFDLDDVRDLYVDVILKSTEYYDAMAQRTLGRSPKHVLLLHENDLAALFVGDLVAGLEAHGFTIVAPTEAFADPIADREPDTLYLGQGRIAALAHEAGADPATLRSPTENEDYLRGRFEMEVTKLPARNGANAR